MPVYTFYCSKCKQSFEVVSSIREYSDIQKCQKCRSSENVTRSYVSDASTLNASIKKSDSELKTLGDIANRNRDRMSDDQKTELYTKHNSYKEEPPPKPLPKGMQRLQKYKRNKWI